MRYFCLHIQDAIKHLPLAAIPAPEPKAVLATQVRGGFGDQESPEQKGRGDKRENWLRTGKEVLGKKKKMRCGGAGWKAETGKGTDGKGEK